MKVTDVFAAVGGYGVAIDLNKGHRVCIVCQNGKVYHTSTRTITEAEMDKALSLFIMFGKKCARKVVAALKNEES